MSVPESAVRLLVEGVYQKEQEQQEATIQQLAGHFGSDPDLAVQSAIRVAEECKSRKLLSVPINYQGLTTTTAGRAYIGKP
ncbi:hypothetical protein [Aquisphaera giovannonii]|uniref:hypothetical protein n=1 Tax=Aquisphaera giovannonii TaxID=406548 RepID=UPI0011E00052|nr:hypothetical protein [Aquisphaera giovannonii]